MKTLTCANCGETSANHAGQFTNDKWVCSENCRVQLYQAISGKRDASVYLVHKGRDSIGPFTRIVAGTDASIEDAPVVLAAYGCRADRPGHYLAMADEIDRDPMTANFASWYSCYNLADERLAELKGMQK